MIIEHRLFSSVNRAAYNPRIELKPKDPEWQDIEQSLEEFGQVVNLVYNKQTGNLVGGHQRMTIMEARGETGAHFCIVDIDLKAEKKLNVVLNKIGGRWDRQGLQELLRELQIEQVDLSRLGFNPVELNAIMTGTAKPTKRDPDDAPQAPSDESAYTKQGDIYEIQSPENTHRLMCGSSTDAKDMARLCGTIKARMVFCDPPYGVSYKGGVTNQSKKSLISGDDLRGKMLIEFLTAAFQNCHAHTIDKAAIYCFYASINHIQFETALMAAGWRVKQQLLWTKQMALSRSDFHWAHEPILYGAKIGQNCQWLGSRCETTIFEATEQEIEEMDAPTMRKILIEARQHQDVWEEKKDPASILQHPNQKPTSLGMRAMRNSSMPQDWNLEPFGGSGSTMIASELLTRNSMTMELSRGHCDAIVRRAAETFDVTIKRNGKKFDAKSVQATTA